MENVRRAVFDRMLTVSVYRLIAISVKKNLYRNLKSKQYKYILEPYTTEETRSFYIGVGRFRLLGGKV